MDHLDPVASILILGILIALAFVITAGLIRAADGRLNAAPAPVPPARVPERAQPGECMRLDCHEPVAVVIHGWGVCLGHDPRAPYDQDITPESVIEAAREITRRAVA